MTRIDRHADYYRAYLADDRSLASVAGVLVMGVTVWLLFYLVSLVGPTPGHGLAPTAERGAKTSGQSDRGIAAAR